MNDMGCERTRELIPLRAAGAVSADEAAAVDGHLAACAECRAEAQLVQALFESRPPVPTGLPDRIGNAVRFEGRAVRRPWWGIAAAAVAVLAVGIGVMNGADESTLVVPVYASEASESDVWLSDDGVIAGEATLDGLSDEALEQLLTELAMGGAA